MPTYRTQVTLEYPSGQGGPGVNVWHLRSDEPLGDVTDASEVLHTLYSDLAGLFVSGVHLIGPEEFTDIHSHETAASPTDWEVVGAGSGGWSPMPTALVTSWYSAIATRSGRGRTFFGPIMGDAIDTADGSVSGEALALQRSATEDFVDANTDLNESAWVIYSQKEDLARDIIRAKSRDRFAVLRSRRD